MFARFCGVCQRIKHILDRETAFSLGVAIAFATAAFIFFDGALVDGVFAFILRSRVSFAIFL
jgi:hypothetical protein